MDIIGVTLPPGTEHEEDIVDGFTSVEVEQLQLKGLPILVDHKEHTEVGTIRDTWVGRDGLKYIWATIHKDSALGRLTALRIQSGALKDLSLTHLFEAWVDPAALSILHQKQPLEVSVCREGRRARCHILGARDSPSVSMPYKPHTAFRVSAHMTNAPPTHDQLIEQLIEARNNVQRLQEETKKNEEAARKFQEESRQYQESLKQEVDKRRSQTQAELDALIAHTMNEINVDRSADGVKESIDAMKNCQDEVAQQQFAGLIQGLVSANQSKRDELKDLQQKLEDQKQQLRTLKLQSSYTSYPGEHKPTAMETDPPRATSCREEDQKFMVTPSSYASPFMNPWVKHSALVSANAASSTVWRPLAHFPVNASTPPAGAPVRADGGSAPAQEAPKPFDIRQMAGMAKGKEPSMHSYFD